MVESNTSEIERVLAVLRSAHETRIPPAEVRARLALLIIGADRSVTISQIAAMASAERRAVRRLALALVEMGAMGRSGRRWWVTDTGAVSAPVSHLINSLK